MANERTILCGDAGGKMIAGDGVSSEHAPLRLRLWGRDPEVTLRIEHLSSALRRNVRPRFVDLIEIATYVYCADQAVTRGGAGVDNLGEDWRRSLNFTIPVREPDFWSSKPVIDALRETLGFLSEDRYSFDFRPLTDAPQEPSHLFSDDPSEEHVARGKEPEGVVLFSGGLDSLGGAVQEAVVDKRRIVLVTHRPTEKLNVRQDTLCGLLDLKAGAFRPRYVPVTINKKKFLSREYTQRSRSFLYASLAAAVAQAHGLDGIRFYENGVVSLNLPLSPQVVGAKATRTTHPRVINGFRTLLSLVASRPFAVDNPFLWKTKTEVVRLIANEACADLLGLSTSCTHTWEMTRKHPHCGKCSQCIDRRFAVLAAAQAVHDPADGYGVDLLIDPRPAGEHRTMLSSYVETASNISKMGDLEFFARYGEVARVVRHLCGGADAVAAKVFDLYKRHATAVCGVIDDAIARYSTQIRNRELPADCLLRMVCDASASDEVPSAWHAGAGPCDASEDDEPSFGVGENAFCRKGQAWVVRFGGKAEFILLPSNGASFLYMLLSQPHNPASVFDLAVRLSKSHEHFRLGDAGPRNDREAVEAYKAAYFESTAELERALKENDARAEQLARRDIEFLAEDIKRRGWGGRPKRERDERERVRKRFQMAVNRTIEKIREFDRELAAHLESAITCGSHPVYAPPTPIEWDL